MKQEPRDLKRHVKSLTEFKSCIGTKLDVTSKRFDNVEENFQKYAGDIITKELNESVISVIDSIINNFKERNCKIQKKKRNLENKPCETETIENKEK